VRDLTNTIDYGSRLKEAVKDSGLKVTAFLKKVNVKPSTYYMDTRSQMISFERARRYAEILGDQPFEGLLPRKEPQVEDASEFYSSNPDHERAIIERNHWFNAYHRVNEKNRFLENEIYLRNIKILNYEKRIL
jgi:hypothetical protein